MKKKKPKVQQQQQEEEDDNNNDNDDKYKPDSPSNDDDNDEEEDDDDDDEFDPQEGGSDEEESEEPTSRRVASKRRQYGRTLSRASSSSSSSEDDDDDDDRVTEEELILHNVHLQPDLESILEWMGRRPKHVILHHVQQAILLLLKEQRALPVGRHALDRLVLEHVSPPPHVLPPPPTRTRTTVRRFGMRHGRNGGAILAPTAPVPEGEIHVEVETGSRRQAIATSGVGRRTTKGSSGIQKATGVGVLSIQGNCSNGIGRVAAMEQRGGRRGGEKMGRTCCQCRECK